MNDTDLSFIKSIELTITEAYPQTFTEAYTTMSDEISTTQNLLNTFVCVKRINRKLIRTNRGLLLIPFFPLVFLKSAPLLTQKLMNNANLENEYVS